MVKKISISFAVAVIIIIAGSLTFIFWKSGSELKSDAYSLKSLNVQKTEKNNCSKHAYDGEVSIKGWYVNENNSWILHIANEDVAKLPTGYDKTTLKLVDGSDELAQKLKDASEANPEELTIKGFYSDCGDVPMVSVAPGEQTFKKYLTQK